MKSYERCKCYRCRRHDFHLCTQKDCVICPDVGKPCQDGAAEMKALGEQLRAAVRGLQEHGCRVVVGRVEDFGVGCVEIIKETKI